MFKRQYPKYSIRQGAEYETNRKYYEDGKRKEKSSRKIYY